MKQLGRGASYLSGATRFASVNRAEGGMRRCGGLLWISFLIMAGFFNATAHGQNYYYVDCSNQDTTQFPSINVALQVAAYELQHVGAPQSYIIVSGGSCDETVNINNANNLNIGAVSGTTVNLTGGFTITGSNSVFLYGFNVTNSSGNAYTVTSSHNVTLYSCTGNGNSNNGLSVSNLSDVAIEGPGSFNDNANGGIQIGGNSIVLLSNWGGPVDISHNQYQGVGLNDGGLFSTIGLTTIQNNYAPAGAAPGSGFGIRGLSESKVQLGTCFGPNDISGNQSGGVDVEENSELSFWSCGEPYESVIAGNGPVGLSVGLGSQLTLYSNATITGHTGSGVELWGKSQLNVFGQNLISRNGKSSDPRSAGIVVDGNSEAYLRGGEIMENKGPGILALVNSSADFSGATFGGNSEGIILCDASSYMVSDVLRAGSHDSRIDCRTPHSLGNRRWSGFTPHSKPDVSAQKDQVARYKAAARRKK